MPLFSGIKRTQNSANWDRTDSSCSYAHHCSSLLRRGCWKPVPDLLMHHWLQLLGLILAWTSPPLLCPSSPPSAQCLLPLAHYSLPGDQQYVDLESHRLSPSTEERFVPTVKDVQWCAPSAARSDHQLHNNKLIHMVQGASSDWQSGFQKRGKTKLKHYIDGKFLVIKHTSY